jgi:hypothetical protein
MAIVQPPLPHVLKLLPRTQILFARVLGGGP